MNDWARRRSCSEILPEIPFRDEFVVNRASHAFAVIETFVSETV